MQPSFTYSDLQKRFCEGFTFFPINGLKQAGRHIYKRYTQEGNTSELFDQHESRCNSGSLQTPGSRDLTLTESDLDELRDIMGVIDEFRCMQEKTIYVLEQWRQEQIKISHMDIMN